MLIYRKFARDQKNILIIKSTVNILQINISMKKPNWKEERKKNSEKRNLRLCIVVKILNYPKKKKKKISQMNFLMFKREILMFNLKRIVE